MTKDEVRIFIEPHLTVLRSIRNGAGDKEILEAKKSLGIIQTRFNYPAVAGYAQRSRSLFDKALGYVDFRKKHDTATEAADYFADRIFVTICECENGGKG